MIIFLNHCSANSIHNDIVMTILCNLVIIAQRSYSQGEFSSQCGLYMIIPTQIKNPLTHPIIMLAYLVHGFGEIITLI